MAIDCGEISFAEPHLLYLKLQVVNHLYQLLKFCLPGRLLVTHAYSYMVRHELNGTEEGSRWAGLCGGLQSVETQFA